jgi:hydrogenase maturation factor
MMEESRILKNGKLPGRFLHELIEGLPKAAANRRLLIGPCLGEDAAHILFGANTLLAKTDPITFATDRIGWYAINVNANDIAVAGGTPKWFLATLMMPPESTEHEIRDIFQQIGEAALEIGVQLAGGHTEVTPAVTQPVICGFMLGEAPASRTVSASGAQPGDTIILTKGIAIEGTSILANECREDLIEAGVELPAIDVASRFLSDPGISVLKDAQTAIDAGGVTAMHDPTEGGLSAALYELAFASNVDIVIDESSVNIAPICQTICNALNIDPWGLISSGALLATVRRENQDAAIEALRNAGIAANIIGHVCSASHAKSEPTVYVRPHTEGSLVRVKRFDRDELARYFEQRAG